MFNANAQIVEQRTSNKTAASQIKTPFDPLKDDILSFFQPVRGRIMQIEGTSVKMSFDPKDPLRKGMRLQAFKEGADFIHPVTREPLGKIEIPIGNIEIESIHKDYIIGKIIKGKPEDFRNAMVKIPSIKTRTLFYQGNLDWFAGDSYYQMLRDSGRFELTDTGIQTDDISKIISEAKAKNASVVLVMSSAKQDKSLHITHKLYWTDDAAMFSEKKITVDIAYIKELRAKSGLPGMKAVEMLFSYDLPFTADRIIAGDFAGDGGVNIALISGAVIRFYTSQVDLNLLWQLKLPSRGDIIWIDKADINNNDKEEILITSWHDNDIISYIYELQGSQFVQLWSSENLFIRGYGGKILGQKFSSSAGFEGSVFEILYTGNTFKIGEKLSLPQNLNIYDFQHLHSPDGRQAILSWNEDGYLMLSDEKGSLLWISKEDYGGFATSFKKMSLSGMFEKGSWSIKDRLILKDGEVYAPKRNPLLGVAKGLGYKDSALKSFWWNGLSIEERVLIDDVGGEIIDYSITEDKFLILTKPILGIKAKNILKGESPLGVMLYIFTARGW
jgi:hypothetical protein